MRARCTANLPLYLYKSLLRANTWPQINHRIIWRTIPTYNYKLMLVLGFCDRSNAIINVLIRFAQQQVFYTSQKLFISYSIG